MEKILETRLSAGSKRSSYPKALREAVELLVEEQTNLVPMYLPPTTMNYIEAVCEDAKRRAGKKAALTITNAVKEIEVVRGNLEAFLRGMKEYGTFSLLEGIFLSRDFYSEHPAISVPEDARFSFKFRPKAFDLGLTGRLLEDDSGRRFQERLVLETSIYDAFDLAVTINPKRIVAVDKKRREIVIYEDYKTVGEIEEREGGKRENKSIWVFDEAQASKFMGQVKVLPANGLKVVYSDFYEKIKKWGTGGFCMIFGYTHKNLRDFLLDVTESDEHLFWDICLNDRTDNTPLKDCSSYGRKYIYGMNRIHIMPSKAILDFGAGYLFFDMPRAIQALGELRDVVTDIWLDPFERIGNAGWDIVFDKRRRIPPEKPVHVSCEDDYKRYHVLKDFRSRAR